MRVYNLGGSHLDPYQFEFLFIAHAIKCVRVRALEHEPVRWQKCVRED